MKYLRPLLVTGAIAMLMGCSDPSVHYDYDSRTPFTAYQTFDWQLPPPYAAGRPGPFNNAIEDGRVKHAVEVELGAKGFRQQPAANPDFLVTYYPLRERDRSQQVHLGLGFGLGPLGIGLGAPVGDPQREAIAGIVLEIRDFRTGSVVWKATAEAALQGSDSPEEADADVKDAVHSMLKRFPPTGK